MVNALIDALKKDKNSEVRAHAAEALGMVGDARVVRHLLEALNDPSERVKQKALKALSLISD